MREDLFKLDTATVPNMVITQTSEADWTDSDHQHPFLSICGFPQLNFMLGLKGCPREEEKK